MKLAGKAYPDLPAIQQNEIVKDRFIDGSIRTIKLRDCLAQDQLEDAMCRAVQLEAIEAAERQYHQPRSVRAVVATAETEPGHPRRWVLRWPSG